MVLALIVCLIIEVVVLGIFLLYFFTPVSRYRISRKEASKITRIEDNPTVSLCIPARNETHALAECLQSALASDYPKLEILVLDDCSQDRTSEIIRGFAHEGVRFIQGEVPEETWLGKNNAYNRLVQEARGEYLVFLSVDTRVDSSAISQLVAYMQLKKISMTSVLPRRLDFWRVSVLFAPLRYFWQFILPLKFNTPLATSLWAIEAEKLSEIGGFEKVKGDIMPENTFATLLSEKNEYHFLIANDTLNVSYEKKWRSQVETSIRLWYPAMHRSVILSFLALVGHFILFLLPFGVVVGQYISGHIFSSLFFLSLCVVIFGYGLHALYFYQTHRFGFVGGIIVFITFPYIVLQEMGLIAVSVYQYKRGRVDWRGRNICYPVFTYKKHP